MAEAISTVNETLPLDEAPPAGGRLRFVGKLKVPLFVGLVIALECSAAYWYLPSAGETAAMAGVVATPATEAKKPAEPEAKNEDEGAGQVEVDLGEFCVTGFQPASNNTLRIDFHLYGTVAADNQKDFARLMEENKHRFRDQVLVTIRGAEVNDLTDAGLALIKRKILDKTNRTLGKPLLQAVIFSDFSFIEQ